MGAAAAVGGGVAAAGVTSSAITSSNASSAAKSAASDQETAALLAQQNSQNDQTAETARLQPYIDTGTNAENNLGDLLGTNVGENPLTSALLTPYADTSAGAWNPTEQGLESTPGYQFTQQQGLEATQNSYAAQGLASSGAALKGAASYATGLADSTYQQQYGDYLAGQSAYLSQNQQIYNMIGGVAGSGQNAAAGLGSLDLASTGQANAATTAAAAAQAAGTVGSANATNSGVSGTTSALSSGLSNYATLSALQGSGLFGGQSAVSADENSGTSGSWAMNAES